MPTLDPTLTPMFDVKPIFAFCQHVLPAVYDDSLSYYELLCKLMSKINEIIDNDNIQVDSIKELQQLYIKLKDYIDKYFKNLDLQDQINNKLDDLGESGELAKFISLYLSGINLIGFKSVADMKASKTLGKGDICRTLGITNHSTGDGSYYLIRKFLTTDTIDEVNIIAVNNPEFVAEKIPDQPHELLQTAINNLESNLTRLQELHRTEIGELNNLKTNDKGSTVGAINETFDKIPTAITEKVGELDSLTTNNKVNVVEAINEVKSTTDTTATTLNDLRTNVGNLNNKIIPVSQGGTGATDAEQARRNLGAIAPYVLYESGGTQGTVTLSDSFKNYPYVEIYYRANNYYADMTKIRTINGLASLTLVSPSGGNSAYADTKQIVLTDTAIRNDRVGSLNVVNGTAYANTTDSIYITYVIGYK